MERGREGEVTRVWREMHESTFSLNLRFNRHFKGITFQLFGSYSCFGFQRLCNRVKGVEIQYKWREGNGNWPRLAYHPILFLFGWNPSAEGKWLFVVKFPYWVTFLSKDEAFYERI